jgi:tripartite-type tricarboxylate transporter receptor subunit TctC
MGLACSTASAQSEYPTKALTIMVGANPGGGSDAVARLLAQKFSEILGKPVVVENRPGASNTIGAAATAKARPDGYTLFVGSSTPISIAPHLLDLNYDTLKDLQPVGLITLVPNTLVINKDMGINTVAELVDYMKKNPNKIKYGSSGLGSTHVVITEQFNISAGVKSVHVPYPGSAPTQIDIIAGVIHITFDSTAALMPQIKAGNLKPLAVTSPKRVPDLPDVPTIIEAGYPDVAMQSMYGLYTTGKTPRPIVEKLNATLNKALADPDLAARLMDLGGTIQPMSVAEFEVFNKKDYDTYGAVIEKANLKAMK